METLSTALRWATAPLRYWGEVLGEKDYEKFVAHRRAHHPMNRFPANENIGVNVGQSKMPIQAPAAVSVH